MSANPDVPLTRYADWIASHVLDDPTGQCLFWCEIMQDVFPELMLARGHAQPPVPIPGRPQGYAHWWLVAENGAIVDPTAGQYPWALTYVPYDASASEPTGRCHECGGYAYDYAALCSAACARAYVAQMTARRQ